MVLILIVVEDALRVKEDGTLVGTGEVLILIVVEDALRVKERYQYHHGALRLNPYCSGRCSPSVEMVIIGCEVVTS